MLAYETARAICEAGGAIVASEQKFLTDLRVALRFSPDDSKVVDHDVDALSLAP